MPADVVAVLLACRHFGREGFSAIPADALVGGVDDVIDVDVWVVSGFQPAPDGAFAPADPFGAGADLGGLVDTRHKKQCTGTVSKAG